MAGKKKARKGRSVRHGLQFWHNQIYWQPINAAMLKHYPSAALMAVSDDFIQDDLHDTIIKPLDGSLDVFRQGAADFTAYWIITQALYLYSHLLYDAVNKQKYRIFEWHHEFGDKLNDLAVERWLEQYALEFKEAETTYQECIRSVGERHRSTGKYGVSGDELKAFIAVRDGLEQLLEWVSVAMVYRAASACCRNLETIESQILHKRKGGVT